MKKLALIAILALSLVITSCEEIGTIISILYVPVSGVSLNKTSTGLMVGDTETLLVTITPFYATNRNVNWRSGNISVATVSNGKVTGLSEGFTIITVTTVDGEKSASCEVSVSRTGSVAVTGVSLNKTSTGLLVNGTETLYPIITPANASNRNVTWSSSNDSVAAVSGSGTVTGVGEGRATITVTTADGGKTADCTVYVSTSGIAVTGISLNKTSASLDIDGTETLYPAITPPNATNQNVTWSSSNTSIATVTEGGVVTAVGIGTAAITVTTVDGGKTASCAFTVSAPPVTFSVAADGSAAQTTTQLTLTFNHTIPGLSAQDITLSGVSGVNKGTLGGTGPVYTLPISGFTAGGSLNVAVVKSGFTINGSPKTVTVYYNANPVVRRVHFTGQTATETYSGLSNNDIYLVKVNVSNLIVNAADSGGARSISLSPSRANISTPPAPVFPRMMHPVDVFNGNPPPIPKEEPRRSRAAAAFVAPVVGDKRIFWVETKYNNGVWVQKQATLRATGKYSNVWVMDESYGPDNEKVDDTVAKTLAEKFDIIYPAETNLLGYEYGGGPGGDGGKDGDPKIQILIYRMNGPWGFFSTKDFYPPEQMNESIRSNYAEIFYMEAAVIRHSPEYIYATLIHEFQHMINFNVKYVKQGKFPETWYNEMLSVMAEDVMSKVLDISISDPSKNHILRNRLPDFIYDYYLSGMTEWGIYGSDPFFSNLPYGKAAGFGAYLMRNYGGPELLKELLANDSVNIESVTAALTKVAGKGSVITFEDSLRRLGEAMLYSGTNKPSGVLFFDNTITQTINGRTYTVEGFDVWKDFGPTTPYILNVNDQKEMRPHSIMILQDPAWKNKSGDFSITLQRPSDSSIEFYLMKK